MLLIIGAKRMLANMDGAVLNGSIFVGIDSLLKRMNDMFIKKGGIYYE
jgi:hypothetical protein